MFNKYYIQINTIIIFLKFISAWIIYTIFKGTQLFGILPLHINQNTS